MNTRHFSQLPKPYLAYPKVIQGLIFKKPKAEKVLPQVEYVVDSFKVDQKHLKAYNEVCGFKNNGYIPAINLSDGTFTKSANAHDDFRSISISDLGLGTYP